VISAVKRGVWAATRPVVRDSRGKTVAVFDPRVRLWRDPPGLDFPQEEFRRVAERIRRATRPRETTPLHHGKATREWLREHRELLLGVPSAMFMTYLLANAAMHFRGPGRTTMIACTAVMLGSVVLGHLWGWRQRVRTFPRHANEVHIAAAMLAENRCPSCAYAIGRVEPAADGCVVCPECAAAWHLGREDAARPVFKRG
jgi:hypothetical protein